MTYQVTKQVFNSKGREVETTHFLVPRSFHQDLIRLLISEGYSLIENDDNRIILAMTKQLPDYDCSFNRYTFYKVL